MTILPPPVVNNDASQRVFITPLAVQTLLQAIRKTKMFTEEIRKVFKLLSPNHKSQLLFLT